MSRRKRAYHHGDLREALVAAGIKLLKEKGAAGLTLRACARAAGVSHAAPKHHFATLGDLLAEIAARGFENFVVALDSQARDAGSPLERLEAMGRGYVRFALDNAAVYGLMFRQGARGLGSPHLSEAAAAAWAQLETAVAAVLGPARAGEARPAAAFVWSSVHGLATLLIDRRFPPDVGEAVLIEAVVPRMGAAMRA